MVHTAECVAPEGNQDRDEWITVIEMQEYMRASRNKAYGLIWSGEIDSYRLGRKLLVSRASVDCVSSRGFEQKEHRKLNSLSIGSAHAF